MSLPDAETWDERLRHRYALEARVRIAMVGVGVRSPVLVSGMAIRPIRADDHLAILHQSLIGEALNHSSMLVFVADDAMRYVAVSSRACEVLGFTRDELLKLSVLDVAFEVTARAEYEEMIATGSRAGTAKLRTKEGRTVKFMYFATEARVAGLPFYVSCGVVAA